ncbi:MAG: glucan 1,4-alpha-glucosidase [Acidobacteria bacterium RIFCSPLOWO2_02_FULL_67_36]|nr:MAG: glucan 1,4-alpha-glucosidase [Acidobacteria bacterium RIFCSPLOWO2_02_FULL_67_36]OFW21925.1 MAG: glucan 1,4-alpha-glucosidase [Acidobacteria bacterium RIFCSPLOWO2_12_FULL_66_21]
MRRPGILVVVFAALALLRGSAQTQGALPFRNPDLPIEQRIDDLIGRLTLDEKVSLMIERAAPVERLGIPAFPWWNEGLHGVARTGRATVFPQAIGLAATWDADLMHRVATAIADEARAMNNRWISRGDRHLYQGLTFWSPNINIFRDPRWGRGQETYGEDPFLTGAMGVAFVKGMQGDDPRYLKTIATPKHFAVHSGPESTRHTVNVKVSDVDLFETYLAAFRAAVVDGKAGSVMCAYNSVRGVPACANNELLGTILRGEWGFTGYVVSDCGAVQDIYQGHKTRATDVEAAALALRSGTDLECGSGSWSAGSPDAFLTLADGVRAGSITERDVDIALRRLLQAQMRLGVYDPPARVPFTTLTYEAVVNSPAHQALALEAARKSIVLLKNDGGTLPLRKGLGTIAVIGANADDVDVLLGNYNGTPVSPVTIRRGIEAAAGPSTKVFYARGGPLAPGLPDLVPVPASALSLTAAYYRGHFDGAPVATRAEQVVDFDWADRLPVDGLGEIFSVRWTGELTAPATGVYTLGFRGATSFRVLIDNKQIAYGRSDHEPSLRTGRVTLREGVKYPIRIEYEHEKYDAVGRLLWQVPGVRPDERGAALDAARAADAVIVVLGLSSELEGEEMSVAVEGFKGGDRTRLDLPDGQEPLLKAIVEAAGAKPVVLVLLNGSAVAVNWADEHVPAILEAWYPGQSGGTAVADVLFGRVSPGGRLPVTFYRSTDQLPPFDDYAMKGRTYRYFTGQPLYPFGYGLSYSTFQYSNLQVPRGIATDESLHLAIDVENSGGVVADEVVQVYVARDAGSSGPLRSLKGFTRILLRPGERRTVRFTLSDRDLSSLRENGERTIEPGRVIVSVGGGQPGIKGVRAAEILTATVELSGYAKRLPR